MRDLQRNTKSIYIAYYKGKIKKQVGTRSVKVDVWETPFKLNINLSIPTGNIIQELFGTQGEYDYIFSTTKKELKLNEQTKVWVETLPNSTLDNNDYIVKNIKKSLNNVVCGLTKRLVGSKEIWLSNGDEQPFEVRLNIEELENSILSIVVSKNENLELNTSTKFWYGIDYNETFSNDNYILEESNIIQQGEYLKYILTPKVI